MFFIEKGLNIVHKDGFLTYIVDTNIHSNPSADIRKFIVKNAHILELVDDLSAFDNVASSQLIMLLKKAQRSGSNVIWKHLINRISK